MKIRIENGAQVREFFRKLDVNLDKAVNIAMNDTSDRMANGANEELSNNVGVNSDLFGSVMSDNNKPYKKYIGRYWPPAVGAAGKYARNAGELEKWRKMKGQKFKNNNQLRYAIWRYGTRPRPFMRRSLQKNKRKFPEYLGKRLAEMFGVSFHRR